MSWYVAKSLEKLRKQLNQMFPNRSKVSDGAIGDAAHASRKSDHNPWVIDSGGVGVVTARDFTFDNNPDDGVGIDCHWLAKVLVASRDPRIKYIIWNRQIISSKQQPWVWRPFTGQNPHNHHLHLSVDSNEALYNNENDWNLGSEAQPEIQPPVTESKPIDLAKGAKGEAVKVLQKKLQEKGFLNSSDIDGDFGSKTETALKKFQLAGGLQADGVCGGQTRKALGM